MGVLLNPLGQVWGEEGPSLLLWTSPVDLKASIKTTLQSKILYSENRIINQITFFWSSCGFSLTTVHVSLYTPRSYVIMDKSNQKVKQTLPVCLAIEFITRPFIYSRRDNPLFSLRGIVEGQSLAQVQLGGAPAVIAHLFVGTKKKNNKTHKESVLR